MLVRQLGSSEINVPAIGFGAWAIGGWQWGGMDEANAIAAIHASLDQGVRLIDTAPVYGFGISEEIVGRAIRDRRDQVVLATKCGFVWDHTDGEFAFHANAQGITPQASEKAVYRCLRPKSIRRELEQSLRRLQTTHIDIYQTHRPDSTTPIVDTMGELLKLKDEGKIRAIGASNINMEQLEAYGPLDSDQEKFSLIDRRMQREGQLAYCERQKIGFLAYSPLANGLLTGRMKPDRQFQPGDVRRGTARFLPANIERMNGLLQQLMPIAERHGTGIAQLVIAWTFSQPGVTCALCGARDSRQAVENAKAGRIELTTEEIEAIGQLITE